MVGGNPNKTSARSPEWLATAHGYDSVSELAGSLPENANVTEVGFGDSLFPEALAMEGKDRGIQVTAVDTWIDPDRSESAPSNLRFIVADVRTDEFVEKVGPDTQDLVTTYWVTPHLNEEERHIAVSGMLTTLRPSGLLSAGPWIGDGPWTRSLKSRIQALRSLHAPAKQTMKSNIPLSKEDLDYLTHGLAVPPNIKGAYEAGWAAVGQVIGKEPFAGGPTGYSNVRVPGAERYVTTRSLRGGLILARVGMRALRNYHDAQNSSN